MRVAIVTGSATGVGAATVKRLAAKGWNVVVNYTRSLSEAEATAAECRALGAQALLYQGDVSDDAACRGMAKAALDAWGRIDALVNNAAITKKSDPFDLETLSGEDFAHVFAVNVTGAYQMIRAVVPAMKSQGKGAVVNVSTVAVFTGGGTSVAYNASKGAVNAMTLTLARTLGPEIRVNAVCPGGINTRWMRGMVGDAGYAKIEQRFRDQAPLGRIAEPDDVAEPIVWLIEGADYLTGETLILDGGLRLSGGHGRPAAARS